MSHFTRSFHKMSDKISNNNRGINPVASGLSTRTLESVTKSSVPVSKKTSVKSEPVDYSNIPISKTLQSSIAKQSSALNAPQPDISKIVAQALKQQQKTVPSGLKDNPSKTRFQKEITASLNEKNLPIARGLR